MEYSEGVVYDYVFITNIPAFYKVRLFNKLAEHLKIKVVFISKHSDIRHSDFYSFDFKFDAVFVSEVSYERRNKLNVFLSLFNEIKSLKFKKIVFSGWETKEASLLSFILPKHKNCIVIESSILETKRSLSIWIIKKLILSRISFAFPSGELQKRILDHAGYKGNIHVTHGVGISNYQTCPVNRSLPDVAESITFIYVGRISEEKNIRLLLDSFYHKNFKLIIVGEGHLEKEMREIATENIHFSGYINNIELADIYAKSDCFILPSISEPWGLVIEEALANGLPVIVSNKVGCHFDLVNDDNGIVFNIEETNGLSTAIDHMARNLAEYKRGASLFNQGKLTLMQVKAYLDACNEKK